MTRAVKEGVSSRVLGSKDTDNIHEHLRNHLHLTNCIHLKNHIHMHRHSPISAGNDLMKDLIVLQSSRSLRDPATSPSLHSSAIDSWAKRVDKNNSMIRSRHRPLGLDIRHTSPLTSTGLEHRERALDRARKSLSKENGMGEASAQRDGDASIGDEAGGSKQETSSRKHEEGKYKTSGYAARCTRVFKDEHESEIVEARSVSAAQKGPLEFISEHTKASRRCSYRPNPLKNSASNVSNGEDFGAEEHGTYQLGDHTLRIRRKGVKTSLAVDRKKPGLVVEKRGLKKPEPRKSKLPNCCIIYNEDKDMNESPNAANSLSARAAHLKNVPMLGGIKVHDLGEEDEVSRDPRYGCQIPWNWSRIHHRGKSFLDMAGRSFSCGLSDSRVKETKSIDLHAHACSLRGSSDILSASGHLTSSSEADTEGTPLLIEPSGSQGSSDGAAVLRDYSGELGIYAHQSLTSDFDIVSEGRTRDVGEYRCYLGHNGENIQHIERHKSFTLKYQPRVFKDVVGQNLTVQALINAVAHKKVGLLYLFYGPHGTGKSSCAHIFARTLTCQSAENLSPCGVCSSCIAHDLGQNSNIEEISAAGCLHFEKFLRRVKEIILSHTSSVFRVFIIDDCDFLPSASCSALSKVIDQAPGCMVFILISSCIDHLPHIIMSRCQKFFFPKVRDEEIISTLQKISHLENIEVETNALKLIAARSDGSLRDAEMTLDQLSLLGQRVSVAMVQELVGLIADENLVDLLDLALSADTVNTVKNLRKITEAGVEPLSLMSQLATLITDILAGSFVFTRESRKRRFFRQPTLSKEKMERLRQALRILSETEKQIRVSNDRLTWLTAALLQLAPENHFFRNNSLDISSNQSPVLMSMADNPGRPTGTNHGCDSRRSNLLISHRTDPHSEEQSPWKNREEIDDVWKRVLERIQSTTVRHFLCQEGKLLSIHLKTVQTAQLVFKCHETKVKAEKFTVCIEQAFQSVLRAPVHIEMLLEGKEKKKHLDIPVKDHKHGTNDKRTAGSRKISDANNSRTLGSSDRKLKGDMQALSENEIVEVRSSPKHHNNSYKCTSNNQDRSHLETARPEDSVLCQSSGFAPPERKIRTMENSSRQSLVKKKNSLAHILQQTEARKLGGWSRQKGISIAEKLEQENLRLEPRSKIFLCWKTSKVTVKKLPHIGARRWRRSSLWKLIPWGKCPCSKSPR